MVDHQGGADRKDIEGNQVGSGSAIFIGTLLDNIPESIILGMSLALGGAINTAFLAAVFVSNLPEGVAGSLNLEAAGRSRRSIFWMWTWLVIISAAVCRVGLFDHSLAARRRWSYRPGICCRSDADHAGGRDDAGSLPARWQAGRHHHCHGFPGGRNPVGAGGLRIHTTNDECIINVIMFFKNHG